MRSSHFWNWRCDTFVLSLFRGNDSSSLKSCRAKHFPCDVVMPMISPFNEKTYKPPVGESLPNSLVETEEGKLMIRLFLPVS